MPEQLSFAHIDAMAAVHAVNDTLRRIDERLIDHGERVAFIACTLCEEGRLPLDPKTLFLLSVFHDIGAYKTEEIDRMVAFETHDVWNHSIYGYLFLKYLSPLHQYAKAILYHHMPWDELRQKDGVGRDYAALIHLADRVDIAAHLDQDGPEVGSLLRNTKGLFCEEYAALLRGCYQQRILPALNDGSYRQENFARCGGFLPDVTETLEYLKMVVYSIDFRSDHTVTHTVNTISLALNIARYFGLQGEMLEKIYLGALLHDVGKIAIPTEILEYPGRLTSEQMDVMRTHVVETKLLIEGIVPEDICQIAIRHHEKLDGSGYPMGLKAAALTQPQRIVAVADIVSALSSRRSYKDPFPKEKTLTILNQMSQSQLDPEICRYVIEHYDAIMEATQGSRLRVIQQYQGIMQEYQELSSAMAG
ncbi:MAG: HD domain-containing protein [Eubacteriales bacterium]|nr:HD domain-containing protein [Eubacteriales bacterium]